MSSLLLHLGEHFPKSSIPWIPCSGKPSLPTSPSLFTATISLTVPPPCSELLNKLCLPLVINSTSSAPLLPLEPCPTLPSPTGNPVLEVPPSFSCHTFLSNLTSPTSCAPRMSLSWLQYTSTFPPAACRLFSVPGLSLLGSFTAPWRILLSAELAAVALASSLARHHGPLRSVGNPITITEA